MDPIFEILVKTYYVLKTEKYICLNQRRQSFSRYIQFVMFNFPFNCEKYTITMSNRLFHFLNCGKFSLRYEFISKICDTFLRKIINFSTLQEYNRMEIQ